MNNDAVFSCGNSPGARPTTVPRLLVSVRDGAEAERALAGGCDILDVKEPARGSLGMADPQRISDVMRIASGPASAMRVSVALGDAVDWDDGRSATELCEVLSASNSAFAKLGTAGMRQNSGWIEHWNSVRERLGGSRVAHWIIVAYADAWPANGPLVGDVLAAAESLGCAGVLIDTFSKSRGGLFDWLPVDLLADLSTRAREAGLLFAIAGKLQKSDLARVACVAPDIVGIRSAACREGMRSGPVCSDAVREFRSALCDTFPGGNQWAAKTVASAGDFGITPPPGCR